MATMLKNFSELVSLTEQNRRLEQRDFKYCSMWYLGEKCIGKKYTQEHWFAFPPKKLTESKTT